MTTEALVPAAVEPAIATGGAGEIALPQVIVDAGPQATARFLVKQQLAAICMLGDWLVVSQVLPVNPAAAVRGPKHVVTKGATPVLSPTEARKLLESIDTAALAGLRDRALLSVMLYSFARVSAVLGMRRQDYFGQGSRGWLRLHEKGREAARCAGSPPGGVGPRRLRRGGRARGPEGGVLPDRRPGGAAADEPGDRPAARAGDDQAARRRRGAAALDVLPHVPGDGDHGVPVEWGTLEHAQQIAGHASPKTTKLYDRTADTVTVDEIERIVI